MNLFQGILLFLAAAVAGAINSIAGGGSFIAFPALMFTGVPPINSNAICSVALFPGSLASIGGYRLELIEERKILPLMIITSFIGGIAGSVIMLKTPPNTFMELVPYLLLIANFLFIFGARITAAIRKRRTTAEPSRFRVVTGTIILQLIISLYGGFFGAGMGIMMLAALALMGMDNIHKMNAFKVVLGSCINGVAALIFISAGVILWLQTSVMIVGAVLGGFGGAFYARKYDPAKVRIIVIFIGSAMTIYFFAKVYLLKT
ncbi:MAG: sulfite exporter TauE/SafE family protein [Ignavibacteriaceae bacterium]|nr:sulfite exporter TauE/SafE family protein [Ignavibacteriaceae bacterium]